MKRGRLIVSCLLALILLVSAIAFTGCSGDKEGGTVRIGTAYSTGGPAGRVGSELLLGAQAATKYYNEEKGGITVDGKKYTIELVEYNSNTNPQEGVSVIKRLMEVEKVPFILGDCISGIVLAQQPVIEEAGWPWIMAASHPNLTGTQFKYTNRCQLDDTIVIGDWWKGAVEAMGANKNFAVLCANNDFSKARYDSAITQIEANGGTVVYNDFFTSGGTDFYPELTKIKTANPDAIYVSSYGEISTIQKQANELGIDVQWYHDDTVPPPVLAQLNGDLAVGTRFFTIRNPGQNTPDEQAFRKYITELSDAGPGSIYYATYAEGWDSAIRAFKALELAGTIDSDEKSRETIVEAIRDVKWDGAATTGSFDNKGQVGIKPIILEITASDGTSEVIYGQ